MVEEEVVTGIAPKSLPDIEFTQWKGYVQWSQFPGRHEAGVYLIASFDGEPLPHAGADWLDPHVVYIGEAGRRMSNRWRAFGNAAFYNQGKNAAGITFRQKYPSKGPDSVFLSYMVSPYQQSDNEDEQLKKTREQLLARGADRKQVETYSRDLKRKSRRSASGKGPLNTAWVKFVERKLLLDFCMKWGKLPDCNKE